MSDHIQNAGLYTGQAIINDPIGLHARPAVKLTKMAKSFVSTVELKPEKQSAWINAKSPNAVMKTRATHGEIIHFRAQGDDAEAAIDALIELVNSFQ